MSRMYWVSVSGIQLTEHEKILLASPHVGGVVLFAENLSAKNGDMLGNLRDFIAHIQSLRVDQPLQIGIDHEGSRVNRFRQAFERDGGVISDIQDERLQQLMGFESVAQMANCESQIKANCQKQARIFKDLGITRIFGPCVDLHSDENSIIGQKNRAFSDDNATIVRLAKHYIEGFLSEGIQCCLKHFPEHGLSQGDSHLGLFHSGLDDDRQLTEDAQTLFNSHSDQGVVVKEGSYLQKYTQLLHETSVDMVMFAHLLHPLGENTVLTTFSAQMRQMLPDKVSTITDCVSMGALREYSLEERLVRSIWAGHDGVMLTHQPAKLVLQVIANAQAILSGQKTCDDHQPVNENTSVEGGPRSF